MRGVNITDTDSVGDLIQQRYRVGETFTANDVRMLIIANGLPPLTEHGGGAIFQHLKRRGVIHKTGHYVPSTNPKSRGDEVAIWARAS
jgi:hypothetical protein